MLPLRIGVCYDFRNPPDSGRSDRALYAQILEQVRWLDGLGADLVWFTEHHFVEDGYLPSWVPVAGAMADLGYKPTVVDYVPCYRSLAGTGNAMGFVYWRA